MTTPTESPKPIVTTTPPICDYEESGYQTDFWVGKGRDYEDAVERIALRHLLPASGQRFAEFGAGFGRLTDELERFDQVVLVDYSRSMLQQAQSRLGRSERFVYVATDINALPFATNAFDAGMLIRVIHHSADPLTMLKSIRGTLTASAMFVLEFANKRNLKSIVRYLTRRQAWSPFDRAPVEFVKLNFDFHPAAMRAWLRQAGFAPGPALAVSMLRVDALKRRLPLRTLTALERLIQPTGRLFPLSPSVFIRCRLVESSAGQAPIVPIDRLFVNPNLRTSTLRRDGDSLVCPQTGARWPIRDGIYDFKSDAGTIYISNPT
ncbi:MAG: methyltransferase domain-containing protein [Aggregatilineales bacterium]